MLVSTSSISINANVGKKNTRKDSVFTIMDDIRKKASNVLDARVSMTNQFSGGQTQKMLNSYYKVLTKMKLSNLVSNF